MLDLYCFRCVPPDSEQMLEKKLKVLTCFIILFIYNRMRPLRVITKYVFFFNKDLNLTPDIMIPDPTKYALPDT